MKQILRTHHKGLHHCLDMSLQEDLSRVRNPNSAIVLGVIRRVVLSLANAAVDRVREKKPNPNGKVEEWRGDD